MMASNGDGSINPLALIKGKIDKCYQIGAIVCAVLQNAIAGASLLSESWGPVWRLAASAGLPPFGPLILPIPWTFQ